MSTARSWRFTVMNTIRGSSWIGLRAAESLRFHVIYGESTPAGSRAAARVARRCRQASCDESRGSGLLLLHRLPHLFLGLEPLLPEMAGKPEIHGGKSEEEQREPAHGVARQEGAALDDDVKPEESVDDARQVEQHDAFLEPGIHRHSCDR